MLRKLFGLIALFGVGYFVPDILGLEKKMDFAEAAENPQLTECVINQRRCAAGEYQVVLVDGEFTSLERTTFTLSRSNHPVAGEILVSSDDNQFGTLLAQKQSPNTAQAEVLIPYCGNPVMKIVLIDADENAGVIIQLPQKT